MNEPKQVGAGILLGVFRLFDENNGGGFNYFRELQKHEIDKSAVSFREKSLFRYLGGEPGEGPGPDASVWK